MELTESEKKGLRRFSLLLESLSDDPWELNLWFDDASLSDSLHHNKYFSSNSASGNIEIDFFMEALLDNFLREIENNNMIEDYCSEEYCRGYVIFEINPKQKTFSINFDFEVDISENYTSTYGFKEFGELNEQELETIQNYKEQGIDHSINFDGGGDSGYIEEEDANTAEPIPSFITEMLYSVLNEDYRGWEIDSGSTGFFEIDYENETIHCSVTEYDTTRTNEEIKVMNF